MPYFRCGGSKAPYRARAVNNQMTTFMCRVDRLWRTKDCTSFVESAVGGGHWGVLVLLFVVAMMGMLVLVLLLLLLVVMAVSPMRPHAACVRPYVRAARIKTTTVSDEAARAPTTTHSVFAGWLRFRVQQSFFE